MSVKGDLLFLAMAFITGGLIPIQAATNAAFSKSIGNPIKAIAVPTPTLGTRIVIIITYVATIIPPR